MANAQQDFILPGLRVNPNTKAKLMYSMSFAHSRVTNPARLEHITYCIWNHTLVAMTDDRADLIIVPQCIVRFIQNDVGASADASFQTVSIPNNVKLFPDFAVVRIVHDVVHALPSLTVDSWTQIRLNKCPFPVLVEAKRPPTRRVNFDNMEQLGSLLQQAEKDVVYQAHYLFSDPSVLQNSVILIACSGEWWRWRIATKEEIAETVENDEYAYAKDRQDIVDAVYLSSDGSATSGDDSDYIASGDEKAEEGDEKLVRNREWQDDGGGSEEQEDGEEFRDIDEKENDSEQESDQKQEDSEEEENYLRAEEDVVNNVQDAYPPPGKFSLNMKLWTPASNQRMFLIHQEFDQYHVLFRLLFTPVEAAYDSGCGDAQDDHPNSGNTEVISTSRLVPFVAAYSFLASPFMIELANESVAGKFIHGIEVIGGDSHFIPAFRAGVRYPCPWS